LYSLPNIIKVEDEVEKEELSGACSMHGRDETCIYFSRGKRPLGRSKRRGKDN